MSLEVTGKILVKYDTVQVSEKFKKREFVIEIAEEINGNIYTNYGKFQLVQNKCDIIDRFNTGDTVKVSFNVKGNSYVDKQTGEAKYISNLDAWRVESAAVPVTPPPARPIDDTPTTNAMAQPKEMLAGSDQLPF